MKNQEMLLEIQGLTRLEQLELELELKKKGLPSRTLHFEVQHLDREKLGELATTAAIVIVSLAAIEAIAVWLSKTRRTTIVTMTAKKRRIDGTEEKVNIQIRSDSSDIETDAIKELGSFFEIDTSSLLLEQ